jgi:hypothetical protein
VRAIDRLRGWSTDVPAAAYSWAALALSGPEVMELLGLVDGLEHRIAELEAAARRCADCGRTARQLIATQDGDGSVVYLGPGCSRKRMRAVVQRAQTLPIGGER